VPPATTGDLALGEQRIDLGVRQLRVLRDGSFVRQLPDADEPRRSLRLRRQEGQSPVGLHRVGRDDIAVDAVGDRLRDCCLARRRRAEDREDAAARRRQA
jgi:hypothetical protein